MAIAEVADELGDSEDGTSDIDVENGGSPEYGHEDEVNGQQCEEQVNHRFRCSNHKLAD